MRARLYAIAIALVTLAIATSWSRDLHAQQAPCTPPWCLETPRITVQTPTVDARAQADARARAEAQARADLEARSRMWKAYWDWEARLRLEARARVNAEIDLELRMLATDAWAGRPPPIIRAPSYAPISFPRAEVAAVGCAGTWSGKGVPVHYGFCLPVRFRVTEDLGFAIDPSFVWFDEGSHTMPSIGFSPGFLYSFASAGGNRTGSHVFVSTGLDMWTGVTDDARNPRGLLGAHVGIGTSLFGDGSLGLTVEARALGRIGIARDGGNPVASDVAKPRVGFEIRLGMVIGN